LIWSSVFSSKLFPFLSKYGFIQKLQGAWKGLPLWEINSDWFSNFYKNSQLHRNFAFLEQRLSVKTWIYDIWKKNWKGLQKIFPTWMLNLPFSKKKKSLCHSLNFLKRDFSLFNCYAKKLFCFCFTRRKTVRLLWHQ